MKKNKTKKSVDCLGITKPIRMIAMKNPKKGVGRASYAAVALETSIWGFGDSLAEALSDLENLSEIQIEFAMSFKCPDILHSPTEKKWFTLWNALQKDAMNGSKKKKKDLFWTESRHSRSFGEVYAEAA